MKKLFFTALTVLIAAVCTQAQIEIRPFTGINFSDVTRTPDDTGSQAKLGVQVGGSLMIGNKLYVQPGIAWFSRSTEFSQAGATNFDQTINGVIIPVPVGYRFVDPTTSPLFNFRVFAGPAVMFLTKTEFSEGALNETVNWEDSQWGAMAGVGIDIAIFFVEAAYEWGLTNAATPKSGSGFSDFRSNTFMLNLGVRLTLAR